MDDEMRLENKRDLACSVCISICFFIGIVFITSSVLHFHLFLTILVGALCLMVLWNIVLVVSYIVDVYFICKEANVKEIEMTVIRGGETCSICLEPCGYGVELVCNHVFHKKCIEKWLDSNPTCPNCRLEV